MASAILFPFYLILIFYMQVGLWIAIILASIAGCLATAFVANRLEGVPLEEIAGRWTQYVWAIIFMVPAAILIKAPISLIFPFLWLVIVPSLVSKRYFNPKHFTFLTFCMFHAGYAVTGILVFMLADRFV